MTDRTPTTEAFLRNRHTGRPHEFETTCRLCGMDGVLHMSVITNDEIVKIEMRPLCDGCGASLMSLRHYEGCRYVRSEASDD